jgi:hypothetical protein
MPLSYQLGVLKAAQGDEGNLALAAVDLAYPALSDGERQAVKDALEAASIPHWFNVSILAAMLDISHDDASSRMARLRTLRIVERFAARGETALSVHESARLALRTRFAKTAAQRFRFLSARAYQCFAHDGNSAERIERVFHLLGTDSKRGVSELEALKRDWRGRAPPEYFDALEGALKELKLDSEALLQGCARALTSTPWGESAQIAVAQSVYGGGWLLVNAQPDWTRVR